MYDTGKNEYYLTNFSFFLVSFNAQQAGRACLTFSLVIPSINSLHTNILKHPSNLGLASVTPAIPRRYFTIGNSSRSIEITSFAHDLAVSSWVDIKMHATVGSGTALVNGSNIPCASRATNLIAFSTVAAIPATDRCSHYIGRHRINGPVSPASNEPIITIRTGHLIQRLSSEVIMIGYISR